MERRNKRVVAVKVQKGDEFKHQGLWHIVHEVEAGPVWTGLTLKRGSKEAQVTLQNDKLCSIIRTEGK